MIVCVVNRKFPPKRSQQTTRPGRGECCGTWVPGTSGAVAPRADYRVEQLPAR